MYKNHSFDTSSVNADLRNIYQQVYRRSNN